MNTSYVYITEHPQLDQVLKELKAQAQDRRGNVWEQRRTRSSVRAARNAAESAALYPSRSRVAAETGQRLAVYGMAAYDDKVEEFGDGLPNNEDINVPSIERARDFSQEKDLI